jgi:hypothetical protein
MKARGKSLLLVGFIVTLVSLAASAPQADAADQLPDLQMANPRDIQLDNTTLAGHELLRFTTVIVNMGPGPFELHGSRPDTSTPEMSVTQRIYDYSGGFRDVPTAATMYYAGDGHNHWHTKNLETAELDRLDSGAQVSAYAKQGFCFSDDGSFSPSSPGAPSSPVYTTCGSNPDQLTTTMGLSVGWGDWYYWDVAYQWIDITGIPAGRYRLFLTVDASHWFQETDQTNDTTWADIGLEPDGVSVLAYDPAATPVQPTEPPPPATPAQSGNVSSFLALRVRSRQKAGKLIVSAAMREHGTITVGGNLNVPNAARVFKLKAVSVTAPAGKTVKITVKLPVKLLKAVRKALKKHKKVTANLTITAKNEAGNTETKKRTIRLRR